jgi:oxygen-dependent protoporphyrinogen oxidase
LDGAERQRIIIVGGGISGLATAERLLSLDPALDVHIFEAGASLGGVMQTEMREGFCMELGPDSILSRLPWGVDLCRNVGLESDLIGTSSSTGGVYVVNRGRLEPIPPGIAIMAPQRIWPIVTSPILSWRGKARLAAEYFVPARSSTADESLATFVTRRLGREALDRLVQPLAGGIYMGDPETLSIQAAFPQFVEMERKHGSLIKAARANKATESLSSKAGTPQESMFSAPRRGMSQFISAIADRLTECRKHLRHRIDRIAPDSEGGWRVAFTNLSSGSSESMHCHGVVLAVPAYRAAELLDATNEDLSHLLSAIPYTGCIAVNLAFDRQDIPHPLDSFGFVSPHVEGRSIVACTFSSVKYSERVPQGKALLRVFLGGACYPEIQNWCDEQVLRAVNDELWELLGIRKRPLFTRISRWSRTMPQYVIGHAQRVARIEDLAGTLPGLELAGNAYRGVGIPHCIRSGQQAAERLLGAIHSQRDLAQAAS